MEKPCTLYQTVIEYEESGEDEPGMGGKRREVVWECELDRNDANGLEGIMVSLDGLYLPPNAQDNDNNDLISGTSTLFATGVQLNFGRAKARFDKGATPHFGRRPPRPRHLAETTGNKNVLAVLVRGADASTTASKADISDSIFGTNGDLVNLKSQYAACSFDAVNITPAVVTNSASTYCD